MAGLLATHPLALRASLPVSALLDEPIVVARCADPVWRAYWLLDAHRAGREARQVLESDSHTEEMALVAAGAACMVTTAAAARYTPHPDLRFVPMTGVPGSTAAVGWPAGHSAHAALFVEVALAVRDAAPEVVGRIEHPF